MVCTYSFLSNMASTTFQLLGGSPGLVVMGDDSCSRGCEFESRRRILDGHFFTFICCKNCIVWLKKAEKERKRGQHWPIF